MEVDGTEKPQGPVVNAYRYNDRVEVFVNSVLVAKRDESTGAIAWEAVPGMTEYDKNVIRNVFAKIPRNVAVAKGNLNRQQRRWNARAMRRKK